MRQYSIRGSATLTRIFLPWNDVPERSSAFFSPSTLPNSTYPKPLGFRSSLSSTMRTLVTSQSAKKSVTSPSVASKERLPKWAVYGGLEGRGRASRVANPRSAVKSLAHAARCSRGGYLPKLPPRSAPKPPPPDPKVGLSPPYPDRLLAPPATMLVSCTGHFCVASVGGVYITNSCRR